MRRYALQAAAVEAVQGNERLAKCNRVPRGNTVDVYHSAVKGTAHYRNLTTCGSVWACPVCAAKVSERRKQELVEGVTRWKSDGGHLWLVTLTFSHSKADRLGVLLEQLKKALRLFQGGAAAVADRLAFKVTGQVRALEVTHGASGWHPHVHILLFHRTEDTPVNREHYARLLFKRWYSACFKAGLGLPNETHGVKVDSGDDAASYVTKWGVEAELTKQVTKEGRGKGRTPMQLLADYLEQSDLDAAGLFSEYAREFKGQRQLVWARGLRAELGLGVEVDDKELADADESQVGDQLLASIPLTVWRLVLKYEVRGRLLRLAAGGDVQAVYSFLAGLPGAAEAVTVTGVLWLEGNFVPALDASYVEQLQAEANMGQRRVEFEVMLHGLL